MIVDRGHGRHHEWMITMNNGLSCVAESWIHYLADCHLKPGDEVVFFYNIDQHLWKVLYRKQIKWDHEEDEADSTWSLHMPTKITINISYYPIDFKG